MFLIFNLRKLKPCKETFAIKRAFVKDQSDSKGNMKLVDASEK